MHQNADNIEIPSVIYKMKSLHGGEPATGGNIEESCCSAGPLNPRMKQLEERQITILERLANLENEVKQISQQLDHKYGDPAPVASIVSTNTKAINKPSIAPVKLPEGTVDFVISLSASSPSFSPLIIGEMLKKRGVDIAFPTHLHSSCRDGVSKDVLSPFGGLLTGRLGTTATSKVYFTFMFKDEPFCPSVMYSPLLQTRIIGDVNVARYLCRFLVPDLYDENDMDVVASVDQWLDTSKQMSVGNTKEKDAALKSLNAHLGKHAFVCDDQLSLADVTLLSALLANSSNFKSLPKNVKPWFQCMISNFDRSFIEKFNVPVSWLS